MKKLITVVSVALLCASCASTTTDKPNSQPESHQGFTLCEDPRPKMCTREYNPVCAVKTTKAECVTPPCLSVEEKTYATGCTACADSSVIRYKLGACE